MIDVTSLADAAGGDVAQVLTDALLDAPGWRDIGPERERHRRFVMWHYHRMPGVDTPEREHCRRPTHGARRAVRKRLSTGVQEKAR